MFVAPNQSIGDKTFAFFIIQILVRAGVKPWLNIRSRYTFFLLNPLAPLNFAEDRVSVKPFSGLNSENLPQNPSQVMHFAAFLQQSIYCKVECKVLPCKFQACAESKISR